MSTLLRYPVIRRRVSISGWLLRRADHPAWFLTIGFLAGFLLARWLSIH